MILRAGIAAGLIIPLLTSAATPVRADAVDLDAIEHASYIFVGTIDIVTDSGPDATDYTVVVLESLKGDLPPQSLVVVREAGVQTLVPGVSYLFLARYEPETLRYSINAVLPTPSDAGLGEWRQAVELARCPLDDVLRLDGVTFARRDWNEGKRYLERAWVGATVAKVMEQDTSATACRDDLANGSASRIPAGTRIHELKGYAPSYRVAVRLPDKHRYLYEAIWSDRAESGADLLDIDDRVVAVEAERGYRCDEAVDCPADTRKTEDPMQLAEITAAVLQAPVETGEWSPEQPARWLRLRLTLEDESTVDLVFDLRTGRAANGLRLPVDDVIGVLWPG